MEEKVLEKYSSWLKSEVIDEKTKEELKSLSEDEIFDRFYKSLKFGTAGLRGKMGAGTNRMNIYTVGLATSGLAKYINTLQRQDKGVVIAYDSRNNSKEFAQISANILVNNGIKVYLFEQLRPLPELSYAIRYYGATSGIMITASHNPPEYNGYKVYWEDGAQICEPIDKEISECIESIKLEDIDFSGYEDKKEMLKIIDETFDFVYFDEIKKHIMSKDAIEKNKDKLKIVYTPLHGTGTTLVKKLLNDIGFNNVFVVPEQEEPDGNFPTVDYPNPEDKKAFKLALDYAKKQEANLVIANDPDADRFGIYVRDKKGEYVAFTGNQSGLVVLEYKLEKLHQMGKLKDNAYIVTTIVSSKMAREMANRFNLKIYEVLTGFKNIAKIIRENPNDEFLFGFEESYGCLIGDYARDKDGISAIELLCDAASYYLEQDKTLVDVLEDMYERYGYFAEETISITKEGSKGTEEIAEIMHNYMTNIVPKIGGIKVKKFVDLKNGISKDLETNITSKANLPTSDVIIYELENNQFFCIRPSGTEPKIKYYIGTKGKTKEEAQDNLNKIKNEIR